jgi:hypothetical protein
MKTKILIEKSLARKKIRTNSDVNLANECLANKGVHLIIIGLTNQN